MLNEGFRYRDLETGTFLTRDPLGFVDGPNVYTYVVQNPWTNFDQQGLFLDTIWDVGSLVYDVARLGKNVVEMGTSGAMYLYGKATGDMHLATGAAQEFRKDAGELGEAGIDTTVDGVAMMIPFVPAGGSKAARLGIEAADGIHDLKKLENGAEVASDLNQISRKTNVAEETAETVAKKPVQPGETGTYGELKKKKIQNGETEPLDMDHRPSYAAQKKALEDKLGRPLTDEEAKALKNKTPAVATPRKDHQQNSRTYGGRNTQEQIAEDANDLDAAKRLDDAAMEK